MRTGIQSHNYIPKFSSELLFSMNYFHIPTWMPCLLLLGGFNTAGFKAMPVTVTNSMKLNFIIFSSIPYHFGIYSSDAPIDLIIKINNIGW